MVIGRRAASRGYAAPHSRQHPQSGSGTPQPRPQRGSAPGAAVAGANPARPAQEAGPHHGSTCDAQRGFAARPAQPQAHPAPDPSSSPASSASGGAGRNAGARVRSRREGPSIPRGADRTLQSPHVAGVRPSEAVARRQSFDGQGAHASSDRVDCVDRVNRAADASRSHVDATRAAAHVGSACSDAGALARSASGASADASPSGERAASEEARRAAERAARQQRMAERRRQAAMAQSRSAEEGAASARTSSTRVAPSREAERQTSRAASPDLSARSSEASRLSAIRAKAERSGAPAHARHAR